MDTFLRDMVQVREGHFGEIERQLALLEIDKLKERGITFYKVPRPGGIDFYARVGFDEDTSDEDDTGTHILLIRSGWEFERTTMRWYVDSVSDAGQQVADALAKVLEG